MWLRNWEHNATSGTPISGAVVEARAASLTSPNTGPVLASTTTNADGMWEFTSLADSAHDIKITYTGNVWWHKGLTKHSVDAIYYTTPTPVTDQYLRNAGFEGGPAGPWTVTNVLQSVFGSWSAINGAGSSAVLSRELTTKSTDSLVSAKVVQTKVSGSLSLYQEFPVPAAMRGKDVAFSVQVHQSIANAVQLYLADSVGSTSSVTSTTTGSFITLTVTRTINAGATVVQAGISILLSSTVYLDNAIWSLGTVPATYRPEYFSAYSLTNDLLATDAVDARVLAALSVGTSELQDDAVTLVKMANNSVGTAELVDANVTDVKMANQKVNRTGDTMTGDLQVNRSGSGAPTQGYLILGNNAANYIGFDGVRHVLQGGEVWIATGDLVMTGSGTGIQLGATSGTKGRLYDATGALSVLRTHNNAFGVYTSNLVTQLFLIDNAQTAPLWKGLAVWHAGNMAAQATLLARANHTGTQTPSTISPQGGGSGLNADQVDSYEASQLLDRANHTGTQLAATISDLSSASVNLATTALTASNATQLGGVGATNYLRKDIGTNQVWAGSGAFQMGPTSLGTLTISGNFAVTGGKARAALGNDGRRYLLSALEMPEPYFEDAGWGQLEQGVARIELPADFVNVVNLDDYLVTLTPHGAAAIYVAARNSQSFVVRSLLGDQNARFTWRVLARQGDLPRQRLPRVEAGA